MPPVVWSNYLEDCDPYNGLNGGKNVLSLKNTFCADECSDNGYSYSWCYVRRATWVRASWQYCDPEDTPERQHLTRWGEYCIGPCGKHGEDYYWCKRGHAHHSVDTWDYCSPGVNFTNILHAAFVQTVLRQ